MTPTWTHRLAGGLLVSTLLMPLSGMAASVTTNEAAMDTIFSQASFGAMTVDIRYNAVVTINVPTNLLIIDSAAEETALHAYAPSASPTVNMFFVDGLTWCDVANPGTIGCALLPGNKLIVDSTFAAGANGAALLAHELGHNLNLIHVLPDNNTNLMNGTIAGSTALTAAQVTTILASGLIQLDGAQRYIQITPILVQAVPLPAALHLMLTGVLLGGLGLARRKQRSS